MKICSSYEYVLQPKLQGFSDNPEWYPTGKE